MYYKQYYHKIIFINLYVDDVIINILGVHGYLCMSENLTTLILVS